MADELCLDLSKCSPYLTEDEIINFSPMVEEAHEMLEKKTGLGNEYLGWLDLPINYDKYEIDKIEKTTEKIKNNSDVFIVIGIGGSYLGARAVIEALSHRFYNSLSKEKRKGPKIYFAGNNRVV